MKTVVAAGLALALIGSDIAAASPKDEAKIRALLNRWRESYEKKDLAGVMSMYAPSNKLVAYDIVPPLQYVGFAAYRKDYQDYFDQFSSKLQVEDRELQVSASGNIGYAFSLERTAGTLKS